MNVYEKKETSMVSNKIESETSSREDSKSLYPSTPYQKVLDYHIAEILLSTIVLAVIALLRMHR